MHDVARSPFSTAPTALVLVLGLLLLVPTSSSSQAPERGARSQGGSPTAGETPAGAADEADTPAGSRTLERDAISTEVPAAERTDADARTGIEIEETALLQRCESILAGRHRIDQSLAALDPRLDELVADLNEATGVRRTAAMAALISELASLLDQTIERLAVLEGAGATTSSTDPLPGSEAVFITPSSAQADGRRRGEPAGAGVAAPSSLAGARRGRPEEVENDLASQAEARRRGDTAEPATSGARPEPGTP